MSSSTSPLPPEVIPSNLKNFLGAVTPKVLARSHSMDLDKSVVEDNGDFLLGDLWHCYDKWSAYGLGIPVVLKSGDTDLDKSVVEDNGDFLLGDLWHCYDKWSAYGLGIPVVLKSGDTVVQYYIPHLSSIQLYTTPFSTKCNGGSTIENPNLSDTRGYDHLTHPYLKYEESISPYWRVPFTEKIGELQEEFTGLNSLKSSDLSPASWMSIMWSPIYHIPYKEKLKSTNFLTYHTLSSHFLDSQESKDAINVAKDITLERFLKFNPEGKLRKTIALPPFGLSSLNMCGDIWINQEAGDYALLIDLHYAVDSWLKQLGVCHNDFEYYNRKNQEGNSTFK